MGILPKEPRKPPSGSPPRRHRSGIAVNLPRVPDAYRNEDFIRHSCEYRAPVEASLDWSARLYINVALQNPFAHPFSKAAPSIAPPKSPRLTPQSTTFTFTPRRHQCPPLRQSNDMRYISRVEGETILSAHGSTNVSPSRQPRLCEMPALRMKAVVDQSLLIPLPPEVPRHDGHSNNNDNIALTIRRTRTPRTERVRYRVDHEGTPFPENPSPRLLRLMPDYSAVQGYYCRLPSVHDEYRALQREFDRKMNSPRSMVEDLGMFELRQEVMHKQVEDDVLLLANEE